MWDIVYNTKQTNAENGKFCSLNGIKRSSPVWSDDTVETIKRHTDNEQCTAERCSRKYCHVVLAVPELVWWENDQVCLV